MSFHKAESLFDSQRDFDKRFTHLIARPLSENHF